MQVFDEYQNKKRKQIAMMRILLDYSMGLIIVLAGVFFLFRGKLDISLNEKFPPNEMDIIFGVMCLLYGGWRIYRGYKKNYFK